MSSKNDNSGQSVRTLAILVAEDNGINRQVAQKMIEFLGHEVDCVENGQAAVDALSARTYDLVLMDCQMPIMDGYEATRAIRRLPDPTGSIPVVAMTAHSFPGDSKRCLESGMTDFLPKPILPGQLAELIDRVMNQDRS